MAYGELKVDTITFTNGGTDTSVAVSGLVLNPTFSGDITSTGTISGEIILGGTTVSGATVSGGDGIFVSGVFTDQISGATITGNTVKATSITGVNIIGTTSVSGATITGGTIVGTTTVSGATVTGTTFKATTITGGTIVGTTTVSGATVTGNTIQGTTITGGTVVGTTTVSGATVTGTAGNFTNITGGASTFTSNVTLNAQSDLRFADADSSNWVAFQAPTTVGSNVTWTLPDADATVSGYALVSDAAGNLSWASAGGGGLTYFTEAESTASPNNTAYVDSFTAASTGTTDVDIALVPIAGGALLGQIPDATAAGGNKRGTYATDWQRSRTDALDVAAGSFSTIGGGGQNKITTASDYGTIPGGYDNECTADYAIACGYSCDGDGAGSTCFGYAGSATGSYAVSLGRSHFAGGSDSAAVGGYASSTSGSYSAIIGSYIGYALADHSIVLGGSRGQTGTVVGRCVIPACDSPIANTNYVSQSSILLCGRQTTDATTTSLGSDNTTVDANNILTLTDNSAFYVKGSCIAAVTAGGDTKAWTFEAVIKRGAGAGTTTLVGSAVKNVIAYDSGAASWDIDIVADATYGGIRVEVTGAASTTIRWVTKFESTETAY